MIIMKPTKRSLSKYPIRVENLEYRFASCALHFTQRNLERIKSG
jgi:hypothetical protein